MRYRATLLPGCCAIWPKKQDGRNHFCAVGPGRERELSSATHQSTYVITAKTNSGNDHTHSLERAMSEPECDKDGCSIASFVFKFSLSIFDRTDPD